MLPVVLVLIGGGVGALLRFGVQSLAAPWISALPLATILVNLIGAFAAGFVLKFLPNLTTEIRIFIVTGLLGGFTTMSSFALEFTLLMAEGRMGAAISYFMVSAFGSVGSCLLGSYLGGKIVVAS